MRTEVDHVQQAPCEGLCCSNNLAFLKRVGAGHGGNRTGPVDARFHWKNVDVPTFS